MVVVTVGGPPGSGTSTFCRSLSDRTGLRYVYAGEIFREKARERDMTLEEFSKLCEKDPAVDRELDETMLEIARREDDVILEGRMTGPLCAREGIGSFKIYIDADDEIRAERVMERDGGSLEDVIEKMREREMSEISRYLEYYGIDPSDEAHYDMILDSTRMTPDEEVEAVLRELEAWKRG